MQKPAPEITTQSEPFWQACKEGRLLIMNCRQCDTPFFYPRRSCPSCWSEEVEWVESTGRGTVWTLSEVAISLWGDAWNDVVPYTVAVIDLDDGVRMASRLVGGSGWKIGDRVQVSFQPGENDAVMPYFTAAGQPRS